LVQTTLELANEEMEQGHEVCIRQPSTEESIFGHIEKPDVHCIHTQLGRSAYYDGVPKFFWAHGEPLLSVGNRQSMKGILELATHCEAFICMREEEQQIWKHIKKTFVVPKGISLKRFRPIPGVVEKLEGEPAVLYIENWRGQRNPLYLCVAMAEVWKRYPKAKLHLYNCTDEKMFEIFQMLRESCQWFPFFSSLCGTVEDLNLLYNRCDIVVSCLHPLYARSIECFGAGKPLICPGYKVDDYPHTCDLDPSDMARAIMACWEQSGSWDFRKWAEEHHDVSETVKQSIAIYERYL